ncbi:helix-turn-helix transcriptional regulator [Spongiactinospora sp. TRM90649]|uniref:helix-turn-helix domain-containing protein n=1 Tax=Spongiactinospora sp. TRM90649 TaxID=3031114 RepID=UPI0023F94D9B|nr:helix-turn-helix transcriptional regulator [Spongiactinospora sp. TRM90649]MDF5758223.1 helix-turn-helix transcriptional regulator [Spongiactinospora sp. TRM90649]
MGFGGLVVAFRRRTGALAREEHDDPGGLPVEIIDEITWYMREHKISRAELASTMGVSAGRVSQILSGEENLTLRTLGSVADALGARFEIGLRPVEEPTELVDDL